ncbi:hypothetical protein GW940_04285 [Candidatus Microgenomates bacterium]|nr:hypothetical protein [Candidatus Microgenomates bacterium]
MNGYHINALQGVADIAVVGSATLEIISKYGKQDYLPRVVKFIKDLRE